MKHIIPIAIMLLINFTATGQLVAFNKAFYQTGDDILVAVKHIDSTQQTAIQINSDLGGYTAYQPKSVNDTLINLGKINATGIYNFQFIFGLDTARYFQVFISDTLKTKKNYFERIPFLIHTSIDSIQAAFDSLEHAINDINARPDNLWPSVPVSKKQQNTWLIAYKAYKQSDTSVHFVCGRYCLQPVGDKNRLAITFVDKSLSDSTLRLLPQQSIIRRYLRLLLHGNSLAEFSKKKRENSESILTQYKKRLLPFTEIKTVYSKQQSSLLLIAHVSTTDKNKIPSVEK